MIIKRGTVTVVQGESGYLLRVPDPVFPDVKVDGWPEVRDALLAAGNDLVPTHSTPFDLDGVTGEILFVPRTVGTVLAFGEERDHV